MICFYRQIYIHTYIYIVFLLNFFLYFDLGKCNLRERLFFFIMLVSHTTNCAHGITKKRIRLSRKCYQSKWLVGRLFLYYCSIVVVVVSTLLQDAKICVHTEANVVCDNIHFGNQFNWAKINELRLHAHQNYVRKQEIECFCALMNYLYYIDR